MCISPAALPAEQLSATAFTTKQTQWTSPCTSTEGQDQPEELRKRKVQLVKGSETKKEKERMKTIFILFYFILSL